MTDQVVRNVPIFGIDPAACRADGTHAPIDSEALQRIADIMNYKESELPGWHAALTSCNTTNPGDDKPSPRVLGHVENVRVVGDSLLADVVWHDGHVDQIPIRRWFTPELWTDRKTGQQWIDPVVAHATKEEIRPGCLWIDSNPTSKES